MLEAAKAREGGADVDWRVGSICDFDDGARYDLAVMTGHAFQCLLTDEEILAAFETAAKLLRPGGVFAFETRNPTTRPWERWRPALSRAEGALADGRRFEMRHDLISVDRELVSFETIYSIEGEDPIPSRSTLRFADANRLRRAAKEVGLMQVFAHGDWDGAPLSNAAPEILLGFTR